MKGLMRQGPPVPDAFDDLNHAILIPPGDHLTIGTLTPVSDFKGGLVFCNLVNGFDQQAMARFGANGNITGGG